MGVKYLTLYDYLEKKDSEMMIERFEDDSLYIRITSFMESLNIVLDKNSKKKLISFLTAKD